MKDDIQNLLRKKNKRLNYLLRTDKSESVETVNRQFKEMVVGLSVYWVIESAKAEADLNNDLKVIDAEINSLNADIAQLDEQYNTKLIPLRAELARIREQIKGYETDRDQALEGCRSKKSLRISEREDFIRIADTEIVDKLVQDMYERLVFIAIKHDLPLDGIVSSSDTSKVMKRFTHDK